MNEMLFEMKSFEMIWILVVELRTVENILFYIKLFGKRLPNLIY